MSAIIFFILCHQEGSGENQPGSEVGGLCSLDHNNLQSQLTHYIYLLAQRYCQKRGRYYFQAPKELRSKSDFNPPKNDANMLFSPLTVFYTVNATSKMMRT